ncbi:microtubule associated protein-domain-containing protein, partial [Pyronema omphalodes]
MEEKRQSLSSTGLSDALQSLHSLCDEIGFASHERETRESQLFQAVKLAVEEQVMNVKSEKTKMYNECQHIITQIKQMERSIKGTDGYHDDDEFAITTPLLNCLQGLKERHKSVKRRHAERYEQVKKLRHALNTYASRLESEFVSIELPPITDDSATIANLDLSDNYYDNLEQEFNRVYDEFTRRANTVGAVAKDIINLYAELGIPREQIDRNIIDYGSTEPERLGLTKDDIERLRTKRGKLLDERERRRNKAESFKKEIQELWAKLGIDEGDRKLFLQQNRGCDMRTLQALEEELHRLLDLKRDNLHIFVEDTRMMIAELWEKMYFGDDEVMDFSPAHSDVYTDALLTAHEMELERLENLWDQRAPIISLVEKHMELMSEKEELAASAQDSSRLLSRGPRDPTRLLREEKTRKRLAKELPKIEVELKKALEDYAHTHGEPLTINGEPYLDVLLRVSPVALSRASSARTPTTTTAQSAQTPGMRGRANTISSTRDHTLQGSVRAKSRPNTKEAPMVKPPQRSKTPT